MNRARIGVFLAGVVFGAVVFTATTAIAVEAAESKAPEAAVVDLTEQWRFTTGTDDPGYASPGFDDSAWRKLTIRQVAGRPRSGWARRNVELPDALLANDEPLILALGTFFQAYEVYIEGELAGTTGGFPSGSTMELPRPRTFPIPQKLIANKRSIVIAVRFRRANTPAYMRVLGEGPYMITRASALPGDAGLEMLAETWIANSPKMVFGTLFLVIGFLSVLAWRMDSIRREFLWFALLCTEQGVFSFYNLSLFRPGALPFNEDGLAAMNAVIANVGYPLYIEFVMAALGIAWTRWWLRGLAWAWAAVAGYRIYFSSAINEGLAYAIAASVLAILLVAWYAWRVGRRASLIDLVFMALLTLHGLHTIEAWSRQVFGITLGLPRGFSVGSYQIARDSLTFVMVCGVILALLMRRVAADLRERQRLAGEMQAARYVQQFLLGAGSGQAEVAYEPAEEVGGEFYHVSELAGGGQLLVVGDVSGKGLKAAFLVSMLTGALRNRRSDEPAEVLRELNDVAATGGSGFVTAVVAKVEAGGQVTIANAGNPAPYLAGSELDLPAGLPLGIDTLVQYEARQFQIAGGQALTFVSDGVVEAANGKGELFGFDRTREISGRSAREIVDAAKAWGQNDDITVVTVRMPVVTSTTPGLR